MIGQSRGNSGKLKLMVSKSLNSKRRMAENKSASDLATFVYVGNFMPKPASWDTRAATGKGFGIYRYDESTGGLELIKAEVMDQIGVGATCLDSNRNILYCVHESMTQPGYFRGGGGLVYALAIDPSTGDLTEINHQPSYGSLPAYPALDATGKYLIVVHHTGNTPITKTVRDKSGKYRVVLEYDEPSTVLFRLGADGSIGAPCDIYKHSGSGPDGEQTHSRLHSVMMSPSGTLFAVCDKGSDKLYFFRINRETETLEICGGKGYESFSGSLPRYGVFHPTSPYFYMNHEAKTVISVFHYEEDGTLECIQTVNVLPDGTEIDRTTMQSDIRIHPSGRYLYDLIRGVNVVSVFAINQETGEIERIQTVKLDGIGPRGCAVSPDGRYLIIALTVSQKIVVWAIGANGKVSSTGRSFSQPSPGNVTFFPSEYPYRLP